MKGIAPGSIAARAAGLIARQKKAADGLAYARAWRVRNKPIFDAMYGGEA